MWSRPLRPDELMHASHKYIDKVRTKGGNWRYIYTKGAKVDLYEDGKHVETYYHHDKNVTSKRDVRNKFNDGNNAYNKNNKSYSDRQERNYHGDAGIERHNRGLYERDSIKTYDKDYMDEMERRGFDSRKDRANRRNKARTEAAKKRIAAEAAKSNTSSNSKKSNPVHNTLSQAKKAVNRGRSFIKSLFG